MALSSPKVTCFQCEDSNFHYFRNGWRLHNGKFAQLCNRCVSLYEKGRFCGTFHSKNEGWRGCEFCGKLVLCGCVASLYTFKLLDFGGVACIECWRRNFKMAPKRGLPAETKTENKEPLGYSTIGTQREPQNLHNLTSPELEHVGKDSSIEPLFEKRLSISDADNGRILLPKKGAEAYFPKITAPYGCLVTIQDTEGKDWEFQFRYWISHGYKTYILEAMKEFMELKQWQPGDIVTFHRIEPGEKLSLDRGRKILVDHKSL